MSPLDKIQLFENQRIRTAWDEEREEWFFSVVDVIAVLTEQNTPRGASNYWAKLKQRLSEEGAGQLLTNCQQLKLTAADGKKRLTDVATTTEISKQRKPENFPENVDVAREGGDVAGIARHAVEDRTGVPVITSKNAAQLNHITQIMLEETTAD